MRFYTDEQLKYIQEKLEEVDANNASWTRENLLKKIADVLEYVKSTREDKSFNALSDHNIKAYGELVNQKILTVEEVRARFGLPPSPKR